MFTPSEIAAIERRLVALVIVALLAAMALGAFVGHNL